MLAESAANRTGRGQRRLGACQSMTCTNCRPYTDPDELRIWR